jgi:hypothetical protein
MLVFSPWAFGTTEAWSIWTMNACGYGLGIAWAIKIWIRCAKGYQAGHANRASTGSTSWLNRKLLAHILAAVTGLLLLYCFVSAANARATFDPTSGQIEYHRCLSWLPHSLDSKGSGQAFLRILALACSFWAAQDWLAAEAFNQTRLSKSRFGEKLPNRINCLLWLSTINGGLLALEGILQRAVNTPKLLFLVTPQVNQDPATQFASYAYRANAGQYFNLLWPVCFGFWWLGYRAGPNRGIPRQACQWTCIALMASCPVLSTARGAALVDFGMALSLLATFLALAFFDKRTGVWARRRRAIVVPLVILVGLLLLEAGLSWKQLGPRMQHVHADLQSRDELYQTARGMARDYALFGTGPGTFGAVFQFYRDSPKGYWPAQLHNDWLEMRLTFGWLGTGLISVAMLVLAGGALASGAVHQNPVLAAGVGLALAGCLVQARWDFPLQVYSILFLFIIWCAVLFALCGNRDRYDRDVTLQG